MPRRWMARILVDRIVRAVGQPDLLEDLIDGRLGLVLVEPVEPDRVAQVLAAGEVAVEADAVGQIPDPALHLERTRAGSSPRRGPHPR